MVKSSEKNFLGKGRKLHRVQNAGGHHGFEGFILAAKIFGKISGQLDTQLTVQTEIGFIGVHYQHPFSMRANSFARSVVTVLFPQPPLPHTVIFIKIPPMS